jgi:hypothetical protein
VRTVRELDHRRDAGIDVRLLWEPQTDRVSLALTDERSGESLSFDVDPSEALTAFHHPYAHASDEPQAKSPSPREPQPGGRRR